MTRTAPAAPRGTNGTTKAQATPAPTPTKTVATTVVAQPRAAVVTLRQVALGLLGLAAVCALMVQFLPWMTSSVDVGGTSVGLGENLWTSSGSVGGFSVSISWLDGTLNDAPGIVMLRLGAPLVEVGLLAVIAGGVLETLRERKASLVAGFAGLAPLVGGAVLFVFGLLAYNAPNPNAASAPPFGPGIGLWAAGVLCAAAIAAPILLLIANREADPERAEQQAIESELVVRAKALAKATAEWSAAAKAGKKAKENGATNGHSLKVADPHAWVEAQGIKSTADVPLPELLIDEVIGQDEAVEVAKKAARQRRHLMLLGDPGTGKSMIAKAMAQILPPTQLDDVLCLPNVKDQNSPKIRSMPGGQGRSEYRRAAERAKRLSLILTIFEWVMAVGLVGGGVAAYFFMGGGGYTGIIVMIMCIIAALFFLYFSRQMGSKPAKMVPNLLIERPDHPVPAPYVDATGSHHGALLGDVRHDPFQSGGLQTPAHLRVEPGAIHRANKGLLFIDEINVLRLESQQALLTAMQERKYAITGQSERSSGAMARTEPVPCDFILVAAGNMDVIAPTEARGGGIHPALRSRIRGYGYEVYVKSVMEDTDDNRRRLVRFVAQEVRRDGTIPHFDGGAVGEVLREAQRRSGHSGKLTLRLRELGGLVRTAGDIARDEGADEVTVEHVLGAKRISMSLEYQVTRRGIEVTTAKEALTVGGQKVGAAVGCALVGTGETGEPAGVVVPVEADATPSSDRQKGRIYLGGGLESDASVADSIAAVVKRSRGLDMAGIDLHVQALLQQSGAEVSPLGGAAAAASVSALEGVPLRQDTVILGTVAVTGRLRGVDGVTQMIEAAADLGYEHAVVPESNRNDILLEHRYRDRIQVHFAKDVSEALGFALAGPEGKRRKVQETLRGQPIKAS
jgi:Lon-like ATP-dependent protease